MSTPAGRCPRCDASFECGRGRLDVRCWCAELPALMPLDEPGLCLCPACLKAELRLRIERYVATVSPESARAGVGRRWADDADPEEGLDYLVDPQGRLVFTRWYLLKRGECCGSGCRHCPYV